MGQEIAGSHFSATDFENFDARLRKETAQLTDWFEQGAFSSRHGMGGFELESWLVDSDNQPAPLNETYLAMLNDALVSPELSRFNVELNSTPRSLQGDALAAMQRELEQNWHHCRETAQKLNADLVMIGILPTVKDRMLTLSNMSNMERYRALNEQVFRLREGRPIMLDIQGMESLHSEHHDVMLESAATSFQIHIQTALDKAVRYYNASIILSAPMVAISANSPLLFGKRLWHETRIPLFEQAVASGGFDGAAFGPIKRVTFGSGYVRQSLLECFQENLEHYPILLPALDDAPEDEFHHLRLHNGTIWRWNRPLIGFDEDGTPHLRIEHRVVSAGPTVVDSIANAAFYYGLVYVLAEQDIVPESRLDFAQARDNFYGAARHSINATVTWLDGEQLGMTELLKGRLLPMAREGLQALGCDSTDIDTYLGIIEARLDKRQTGAAWQLAWLDTHGDDLARLVATYRRQQNSGLAVHEWPV